MLSNLAAGVMLLICRPFRIDVKVQIGGSSIGTVKELSLFWTELVTTENKQVIVPNSGVWGHPLRNYSVCPAPPHAGELRFQIVGDTEFARPLTTCKVLSRPSRACSRTRSRLHFSIAAPVTRLR